MIALRVITVEIYDALPQYSCTNAFVEPLNALSVQ